MVCKGEPVTRPELLDTIRIEGTERDGAVERTTLGAHIGEDWGVVFAQGGVPFALMIRAGELVLDRADLRPVSASATFIRPVHCAEVTMEVTVLRSGRSGAQIQITLHDPADPDPTPNVVAMLIAAAIDESFPSFDGVTPPLASLPDPQYCERVGAGEDGLSTTAFFRRTDWRRPGDAVIDPTDPLHRMMWFSFGEHIDQWDDALLPIPADALGIAALPAVTDVVGPLISPSLEISLHFHAPARGDWLAIDSRCHRAAGGLAWGVTTVWNRDGSLVATASQTAILRRIPNA